MTNFPIENQETFDHGSYQAERAVAYPPIGDQLDDLYHAGVFSADMSALIKAVKDKFPKE
jgi:hypothetical protein